MAALPAPSERGPRAWPVAACLAAWLAGAALARVEAAEAETPPGPCAVLVLYDGLEDEASARLAGELHAALTTLGPLALQSQEETARRLSRGAPAGQPGAGQPGADLDRLRGLFQQAYLQTYSFEYGTALRSLETLLLELEALPASPERWELYRRGHIFLGLTRAGLKDEAGARQAFAAVLRTLPELVLARTEFSPKAIALWEQTRTRLRALPRGKLIVDSEPSGAAVCLDGQPVGQTPYIGDWPRGSYSLEVRTGPDNSVSQRIQIGAEPLEVRVLLAFESSLELGRAQPGIRLPAGQASLPDAWWPWLGARLGLGQAVVLSRRVVDGRMRWTVALMDLMRARPLREGWLEAQAEGSDRADARVLALFAATGQQDPGLVAAAPVAWQDEAGYQPGEEVSGLLASAPERPWLRRWWPWALGGLLAAGAAAGATAGWDWWERQADQALNVNDLQRRQDQADLWQGVAVIGYCLAGALLATGLALHFSWAPEPEDDEEPGATGALAPFPAPGGLGLEFSWRF
jgi:hypothetical protein